LKIFAIFISIILFHFQVLGQQDFIRWNNRTKISWADFKGPIDARSPFAAMSAVGIYYKYKAQSTADIYNISFDIYAKFDKTKTWSKKNLQTAVILKHEQLHFDLCEIVCRAFKDALEKKRFTKNYKKEIDIIFDKYFKQLQSLQQKYDSQTMHSNNKAEEQKWDKLIKQELLR